MGNESAAVPPRPVTTFMRKSAVSGAMRSSSARDGGHATCVVPSYLAVAHFYAGCPLGEAVFTLGRR